MSELNLPACPVCHAEDSLVRQWRDVGTQLYIWYDCRGCGSVLLWTGGDEWVYQKGEQAETQGLLGLPLTSADLQGMLPQYRAEPSPLPPSSEVTEPEVTAAGLEYAEPLAAPVEDYDEPLVAPDVRYDEPLAAPAVEYDEPLVAPLGKVDEYLEIAAEGFEEPVLVPASEYDQFAAEPVHELEETVVAPAREYDDLLVAPTDAVEVEEVRGGSVVMKVIPWLVVLCLLGLLALIAIFVYQFVIA